jgi:hypothetical protein
MIGTPMGFGLGKYRLRTWLRMRLPYFLSDRIPKGRKDCGHHEWYRSDDETLRCYHCEVGMRHMGGVYVGQRATPDPRIRTVY